MEESILNSIKKLLGIEEDYTHFDQDVMMHINSVFATLHQIGLGPDNGYEITSSSNTWSEYCEDVRQLGLIKTYIYLKVRLVFDPPANSFVVESINKQISELEWRMYISSENDSV